MKYRFIVLLLLLPFLSQSQTEVDSLFTYDYSDFEHVPADADYGLIEDRLSCIQGDIPLHFNTRVHAFINYFAVKDREYTNMVLARKNLYFPLFEKYLQKYGLPDELKYLSIIESGLNPRAISPAKAVGLWQFMAPTGRYFGLHQDWYMDERMDPERSTEAACKYLKQLYTMFSDWELAIAAYNTGPGNIRKAIRRSGYKRSFWEIYPHLYRETRSYLPQFVAMIYVMNYYEEHNFADYATQPIEVDTIQVDQYLHLETLATQLGLCEKEIKDLNPALKQGVIPDNTNLFALNVPTQTKEILNSNRKAILDSASKVGKQELEYLARNTVGSTYGRERTVHTVGRGDVIGIIAERYKVRISDVRAWNNLRGNTIRLGQKLVIWKQPGVTKTAYVSAKTQTQKLPAGAETYIVQPGDTLWDISRKFEGLSIEKIKSLNQLKNSSIKPGQQLIINN